MGIQQDTMETELGKQPIMYMSVYEENILLKNILTETLQSTIILMALRDILILYESGEEKQ